MCRSQRLYLPSLRNLVSDTPRTDETQILSYLGQGVDCGLYNDPGLVYDVLQPGKRIELSEYREFLPDARCRHPQLLLTDGVWVWPGALVYYVAVYHIPVPQRFLHQAAALDWRIDPAAIHREELNWDAFDAIQAPAAEVSTES